MKSYSLTKKPSIKHVLHAYAYVNMNALINKFSKLTDEKEGSSGKDYCGRKSVKPLSH
jgi:hypothetical protein